MNLDSNSDEQALTTRRRQELKSLHRARGRRELGQYLIEGVRAVEAAQAGGAELVDLSVSHEAMENERVRALVARAACPVRTASARDLEAASDARTSQGIIASARFPPPLRTLPPGSCLVLDGVQDPGNVGTLIRTAAWYGISAVICGPETADPFQPKVVRSSQGGLWDLAVGRVASRGDLLGLLAGRQVFVAHMSGEKAGEWTPTTEAVLVIGSEAHGPSPEMLERADGLVTISRRGQGATESLNAGVAGAILMDRWLGGG